MQVENALPHEDRLKNIEVVKIMLIKDSGSQHRRKSIKGSWGAASVVKEFLAGEDREVFLAICLDRSCKINSINIVSIGSLEESIVHPREVFKPAILSNADSIVIAHNHPSGNQTPSEEDIRVTQQLFKAAKLLGIKINEHIIIGEDEYTSISPSGDDVIFNTGRFRDSENARKAQRTVAKGKGKEPKPITVAITSPIQDLGNSNVAALESAGKMANGIKVEDKGTKEKVFGYRLGEALYCPKCYEEAVKRIPKDSGVNLPVKVLSIDDLNGYFCNQCKTVQEAWAWKLKNQSAQQAPEKRQVPKVSDLQGQIQAARSTGKI